MVVEESGVCIEDATVELANEQGRIQSTQQLTPCDAWAYGSVGAMFVGLPSGAAVTVRGSAPGYETREKTVIPSSGGQTATILTLPRVQ